MRLIYSVLILLVVTGCDQAVDSTALLEQAESADLPTAYALHERLFQSTIPADDRVAVVIARHGQAARDLALAKARTGSQDEIEAAIPVILMTGESLNIGCTSEEFAAIERNVSKEFPSGDIREGARRHLQFACGLVSADKVLDDLQRKNKRELLPH